MVNILLMAYGLLAIFVGQKLLSYTFSFLETKRFTATSPIPSVSIFSHRDSMWFWLFSLRFASLVESLPFNWGHWMRYAKKDFSWLSQGKLARDELGSDTFWLTAPGGPALWTGDAEAISQIVHRWKDFSKSVDDYVALDVYGPNVVTTEGPTWQRHRKITAPPFNEKNSSLVFQQTVSQVKAMLHAFTHDANGEEAAPVVKDLIHWTLLLTLNVLSGASLNLKIPWPTKSVDTENGQPAEETHTAPANGDILSFHECVAVVMDNIRKLIAIPTLVLRYTPLRYVLEASDGFVAHMHEMIEAHGNAEQSEKPGESKFNAGDLLSNIVNASSANKGSGLSEREMIGNIFVFVVAGHETTASTVQTALIYLATDPEFQQQVQKEIDEIWATKAPGEDLSYDDYPKMRIIMALMASNSSTTFYTKLTLSQLEDLRLYPPVVALPKITTAPQTLNCNGKELFLPANSRVSLDVVAVQRNPKYWGPDAQEFRPSRWLMPSSYTPPLDSLNESTAHANLFCPQKGAFLAFSGGFRGCLGRKFAQVEFCTMVAVLLKDHSIELVPEMGAGWKETRGKALAALEDRETALAMRMNKNVKVRFVRRGVESFPPRE
ncbi:Cytochrome P450 72A14 [Lachnellula suecica]|uniref:Cytochrome P450 72A14 n=1 Tax=Lachnellula suecica TaxID=602035 RepID=A0A8T9C8Z7_9HELO|nr:Cytochrome P450 72A14 [Lachnellula suecica]